MAIVTEKKDIANLALLRCGQTVTIATWPETTTTYGAAMATLFDHCAAQVLKAVPWPFARRSAALQYDENLVDPEWLYAYHKPGDMIVPVYLVNPTGTTWVEFAYENDHILTNVSPESDGSGPSLRYITNQAIDPAQVEPSSEFTEALSWKLAQEYAPAIAGTSSLAEDCRKKYELSIIRAKNAVGKLNKRSLKGLSEGYIDARWGS